MAYSQLHWIRLCIKNVCVENNASTVKGVKEHGQAKTVPSGMPSAALMAACTSPRRCRCTCTARRGCPASTYALADSAKLPRSAAAAISKLSHLLLGMSIQVTDRQEQGAAAASACQGGPLQPAPHTHLLLQQEQQSACRWQPTFLGLRVSQPHSGVSSATNDAVH
jgi:hypothetical protein